MTTVNIELDDTLYELKVSHFSAERLPNRRGHIDLWDDGDGGEIELEDSVKVWGQVPAPELPPGSGVTRPGVVDRISLEKFIRLYAAFHGVEDRVVAEQMLMAEAYEDVSESMKDEYDVEY